MADSNNTDIKKLPFERAIDELESIVKRLEEGKVPLEESVAIYERGEALKRRCEELLRQAEARGCGATRGRGAEAPLRGIAAAGRGAGRQDHHRCRRPGDRHGAAGRAVTLVVPAKAGT